MNKDYKRYIKNIRAQIQCSRSKKAELLAPFLRSMQNYELENETAFYHDLVNAFGTPEEMAETLAEQLTEKDIRKYKCCKTVIKVFLIFVIGFVLVWSIYLLFFANAPVEVTQTIIVE